MATIISNMPSARLAPRPSKTETKPGTRRSTSRQQWLPLLWMQRLVWRAELRALDAAQLRDCGLDPTAVAREAMKPFWRG